MKLKDEALPTVLFVVSAGHLILPKDLDHLNAHHIFMGSLGLGVLILGWVMSKIK